MWTKLIKSSSKSLEEIKQYIDEEIADGHLSKEDFRYDEDYKQYVRDFLMPEFYSAEDVAQWALKYNMFTDYAANRLKEEIAVFIEEILEEKVNNIK
ncbi:MAG: hypothetical protein NC222_06180 [Staphylococcus sp.]|nr:hypothetical protein [Staphylococcus sp.]